MPKRCFNDITGKRFGRLVAVEFLPDKSKFSKFRCVCDCGAVKVIFAQSLIRGATVSCGCYQREKGAVSMLRHGHSGKGRTKTYNSWAGMMDRCEWGGHPTGYARYGARGIRVDPRWHAFENFLADMGERPPGTSIDRIDNARGYGPGNCRWATRAQQALNTSRTVRVIYEGAAIPVKTLCERLGLSGPAVRSRAVRRGYDYVAALTSMGIEVCADERATA